MDRPCWAIWKSWESIEAIVLSHEHGDHTGGLQDLLATGIHPKIYIPAAMAGKVTQAQRE
ncbi:MAG: MBL fold metallo-hydrolase [Anaerolineales bacterium]|jgi:metal-dependent hydrolase (beta-lactamase superfamily II)|nr:MAG: MBL fold metallo-hydrolase [Anaerolineales bacterium]